MGHTKPNDLEDLKKEFAIIRKLENVLEKKPGIFYLKSMAFLHFHDSEGKRWADVKTPSGWKNVAVDFKASTAQKAKLLKEAKVAHSLFTKKS